MRTYLTYLVEKIKEDWKENGDGYRDALWVISWFTGWISFGVVGFSLGLAVNYWFLLLIPVAILIFMLPKILDSYDSYRHWKESEADSLTKTGEKE